MQFLCSIWNILHLTEYFYTGTAHGARNNYQVCKWYDRVELNLWNSVSVVSALTSWCPSAQTVIIFRPPCFFSSLSDLTKSGFKIMAMVVMVI